MHLRTFASVALVAASVACSHSPAAPSGSASTDAASASFTSATAGVVNATVAQIGQATIVSSGNGPASPMVLSYPCPNGGTITTTYTFGAPVAGGPLTTSARSEFNDCQSQNAIIRGDPYLLTSGEYQFTPGASGSQSLSGSSRMHTTGGLRAVVNGLEGRTQYNCTHTSTWQYNGTGTPQITSTSAGTISIEFPIGTAPRTASCGPTQ